MLLVQKPQLENKGTWRSQPICVRPHPLRRNPTGVQPCCTLALEASKAPKEKVLGLLGRADPAESHQPPQSPGPPPHLSASAGGMWLCSKSKGSRKPLGFSGLLG